MIQFSSSLLSFATTMRESCKIDFFTPSSSSSPFIKHLHWNKLELHSPCAEVNERKVVVRHLPEINFIIRTSGRATASKEVVVGWNVIRKSRNISILLQLEKSWKRKFYFRLIICFGYLFDFLDFLNRSEYLARWAAKRKRKLWLETEHLEKREKNSNNNRRRIGIVRVVKVIVCTEDGFFGAFFPVSRRRRKVFMVNSLIAQSPIVSWSTVSPLPFFSHFLHTRKKRCNIVSFLFWTKSQTRIYVI